MTSTRNIFIRGLHDGIPIAMGYFAVAFSLGIIAGKVGLSAVEGFLGSFFTRASAGEYGVYTLIGVGASYGEIVAMSLVTNLRYILMSTALTQKFSPQTGLAKRLLVSCCITDEVFGISIAYPGHLVPSYPLGAMLIAGIFWAAGTASGIIVGGALPTHIVAALSVALYGMFIAIIIPPAKKDRATLVAILASFCLSWLCGVIPWTSTINTGTRTIILTLVISIIAAIIKPVKFNTDETT